jgi:GNAT superfamily N-acetyltransferase
MTTEASASGTRQTSRITVRAARPEDLAQCREIAIAVFQNDFGYGYLPQYHYDIDDLETHYLKPQDHALFVAIDDATGEVIGLSAVKHIREGVAPDAPKHLVERYDRPSTAELVRVYTHRAHRRRGVGKLLVAACKDFAASRPVYETMFLHTDATYPGAKEFWLSQGQLVHDNRQSPVAGDAKTMFFEIALDKTSR